MSISLFEQVSEISVMLSNLNSSRHNKTFDDILYDMLFTFCVFYKCLDCRGVQRHPGDAKCVTEIIGGDKNKEVGGNMYPFVSRKNRRIKPIKQSNKQKHGN